MSQHPDDRPFSVRTPFGFLLGLVSVVLLPPAVALAWLSAVGTRADLFVDTLGPVVRTTEVQQSLTAAITSQAMGQLRVGRPERSAIESAVRGGVAEVVASEAFASIWTDAVRGAHAQLVSAMASLPGAAPNSATGATGARSIVGPGGQGVEVVVRVPLDAVQGRLANLGVTVPANLTPTARVSVLSGAQVDRMRPAYGFVSTYGLVAPFIVVGLGVVAVGLAVLRRRAALWLFGGWGLGLALLAAVTALARPLAVDLLVATVNRSTSTPLPIRTVAQAAYDAVSASFERWLVVGGVAVAVALLVLLLVTVFARPRHRPSARSG